MKGLVMSESWLFSQDACRISFGLSFADGDGVGCPGGAWLRKTQRDSGRQRRKYKAELARDLLQHVSSFILARVGQPPPQLPYTISSTSPTVRNGKVSNSD